MSITKKILLASLMCCMFGAVSMFGDTLTVSCTIGLTTDAINTSCGATGFNNAWGALTGVTLQLSGVSGFVQPLPSNSTTTSWGFTSANAGQTFKITGPDGTSIGGVQTSADCSATIPNGVYNGCAQTALNAANYNGGPTAVGNVAPYITATVTLNAIGNAINFNISPDPGVPGGALAISGTGQAGGTVTLVYTYSTGVPEPATMFLMGGSLIGVGLVTRRRRQNKA
jgi:hypothetical protein